MKGNDCTQFILCIPTAKRWVFSRNPLWEECIKFEYHRDLAAVFAHLQKTTKPLIPKADQYAVGVGICRQGERGEFSKRMPPKGVRFRLNGGRPFSVTTFFTTKGDFVPARDRERERDDEDVQ